jgi:hypothetical protein
MTRIEYLYHSGKLLNHLALIYCPSEFGLRDDDCDSDSNVYCIECWQKEYNGECDNE